MELNKNKYLNSIVANAIKMQSLRAVKRLQGALPQWLRGITASSVEESGSLGVFTLVEAPSVSYMLRNRTRTFTSAAMASREYYDLNGQAVEDDIVPEEFETIEAAATMDTVHKLPTDINEIGRLNPELLEAMQAHEQHIRYVPPLVDLSPSLNVFN